MDHWSFEDFSELKIYDCVSHHNRNLRDIDKEFDQLSINAEDQSSICILCGNPTSKELCDKCSQEFSIQ